MVAICKPLNAIAYVSSRSSDFGKIWCDDAHKPSWPDWRMAAIPKIKKSQYLHNLGNFDAMLARGFMSHTGVMNLINGCSEIRFLKIYDGEQPPFWKLLGLGLNTMIPQPFNPMKFGMMMLDGPHKQTCYKKKTKF